jgi:Swt1-like HEPN
MTETLRLTVEHSGFQAVLENVRRNEELARAAFGPLEELERAGLFNIAFPHQHEMEVIRQAVQNFEAGFRLPEIAEARQLIKDLQFGSLSEAAAKIAADTSLGLQRAIESMNSPWIDRLEQIRSLSGFVELQGIGHLLREMPTFDDSVAAALRVNLGDWRDQITWRPEIFTDLAARSDFYLGLGFNPDLTKFPLPAFEESLDIAGLRSLELPPLLDKGSPPASAPDEEEGLTRTNAAHDRLQRLERMLRKFIDEVMTRAYGPKWVKARLPNGLYDRWLDKQQKAAQAGAEELPLVEYADFTDYELIICRADNWREVFANFFNRRESVREFFQRLYPIRLDTMHARLIRQDDELLLHVEVMRLVKGLKRNQ